jgi:hypothetical protein
MERGLREAVYGSYGHVPAIVAKMDGRNVFHFVMGMILLLAGSAALCAAAIAFRRRARAVSKSVRVPGTITGFHTMSDEGETRYAPIVEFVAPDGRTLVHRANVFSPKPEAPVGTRIVLCCPVDAPELAVIDDFWHQHLLSIALLVLALVFLVNAVVCLV